MRKPLFIVFLPDKTQTDLCSYRDLLVSVNVGYRNFRYYTIKEANNKNTDQSEQIHRLSSVFVVHISRVERKTVV